MRTICFVLLISFFLFACSNETNNSATSTKDSTNKKDSTAKDSTNPNAPGATNAQY